MSIETVREHVARWCRVRKRARFEADMNEELRLHIDMLAEQFEGEGLSPTEARRQALIEFGGVEQTLEECRENVGSRLMSDLVQDVRYAIRTLLRSPGFTIVAVLTLAIGIGANTAVFSVVNTLLLKPLPFDEPERIVMLWQGNSETGVEKDQVAWADYFDWQDGSSTIERFGCVVNSTSVSRNFLMWSGGDVARIRGRHVSSGLFDVLGVRPMLGQTLEEADDEPGGLQRAVLSYSLWSQAFGSDQEIIGQTLDLGRDEPGLIDVGGEARFEIVGVMPPDFRFPQEADIWLSIAGYAEERSLRRTFQRRDAHRIWTVGRLRDGISVEQATAELNTLQRQIADDPQNQNIPRLSSEVVVTPLLDQVNGQETRPTLLLLMGAVAFVLLIACANVANLLLVRAMSRRREIAVRVALGASRARVVRQLLTESLMLSVLAAAVGVLLAIWGIDLLELIHADSTHLGSKELRFDRLGDVALDPAVLGFTVGVSVLTGTLFGLIPGFEASRLNVNDALKEDSRSSTSSRATRYLRNSLLVSEVALALVLLVGAGIAIRGFYRLMSVDVGMETENVVRAELDIDMARRVYGLNAGDSFETIVTRLRAVPGVLDVSGSGETPLVKSGWNDTFRIMGPQHETLEQSDLPPTDVRLMSPGSFQTLGIPLLAGRDFTEADDSDATRVTIINEALRQKFFGDEDPVGQIIRMRGWETMEKTIVGVVGSTRNFNDDTAGRPELYFPFKQSFFAGPEVGPVMLIRVQGDSAALIPAMRDAVDGPSPGQQVLVRFRSLDDILDQSASSERFRTVLLGCFAGAALLLAVVGVFGTMSYTTSQRTQEFGIRMALGAQPGQILQSVASQGMALCLIGIAIGAGLTLILSKILSSLIFGLEGVDFPTLAGVSSLLLMTGMCACLLPAWRAMRVDPAGALRHD